MIETDDNTRCKYCGKFRHGMPPGTECPPKTGVGEEAVRQPCSCLGRDFTILPAPTPGQYPVSGVEYSGNDMGLFGDPTTLAKGQVIELLKNMMGSAQN